MNEGDKESHVAEEIATLSVVQVGRILEQVYRLANENHKALWQFNEVSRGP